MRTPQRVEQFHKELEDKKAKALRRAAEQQPVSAGSLAQPAVESTKGVVETEPEVILPTPAPVEEPVADDTAELAAIESMLADQPEVATDEPAEDASAPVASPAQQKSGKRR